MMISAAAKKAALSAAADDKYYKSGGFSPVFQITCMYLPPFNWVYLIRNILRSSQVNEYNSNFKSLITGVES